ncbi:hypothetical protein B0J11DRAFT_601668 [Dendryphion nanum]|uniref:Uncharacterized protein n=1 Tax=Dendryphion nanum TaxID=256645 RepID=A0A9P9I6C7_9PLEO|nr:hypothetical protein B0J11DRAFT_601668 [Dendryphion nanum]
MLDEIGGAYVDRIRGRIMHPDQLRSIRVIRNSYAHESGLATKGWRVHLRRLQYLATDIFQDEESLSIELAQRLHTFNNSILLFQSSYTSAILSAQGKYRASLDSINIEAEQTRKAFSSRSQRPNLSEGQMSELKKEYELRKQAFARERDDLFKKFKKADQRLGDDCASNAFEILQGSSPTTTSSEDQPQFPIAKPDLHYILLSPVPSSSTHLVTSIRTELQAAIISLRRLRASGHLYRARDRLRFQRACETVERLRNWEDQGMGVDNITASRRRPDKGVTLEREDEERIFSYLKGASGEQGRSGEGQGGVKSRNGNERNNGNARKDRNEKKDGKVLEYCTDPPWGDILDIAEIPGGNEGSKSKE